jgi:hypothetical protein
MSILPSRCAVQASAHDPVTCGIYPDADCPACRAAREQEAWAEVRRQTEIERRRRTHPQAEELAEVLQAQRDLLAPILLAMLEDGIGDIALIVAQEVQQR